MSIPQKFKTSSDYFKETILFLKKYQWLYSIPNTHILSKNLFENFPKEWIPVLETLSNEELNNLPFGYFGENWPKSLQEFIITLQSLKPIPSIIFPTQQSNLTQHFFKGLNQKKIHEILAFAPFIHENCQKNGSEIIIDIGAGLGYLPQLLHKHYGYKILAIEADKKKIESAIKRQKEMYGDSLNYITYVEHFVNENSVEFLEELVGKNFENSKNICLIGLHACADLSVTLLKLFSVMVCVNQAIVMPCCYHRLKKVPGMNPEDQNDYHFMNFPVSSSLKDVYNYEEAYKFLTGAFLRLACQNTVANWKKLSVKDHKIHALGAMRRNVLQLVADTEGYHLSRLKRKTQICEKQDFLSYLNGLKHTHKLTHPSNPDVNLIASPDFHHKMLQAWENFEKYSPIMEVYTCLQTSLQNICENVVLLDRIEMVKELEHVCFAQKITDDVVSPRCYAIVATKHANS